MNITVEELMYWCKGLDPSTRVRLTTDDESLVQALNALGNGRLRIVSFFPLGIDENGQPEKTYAIAIRTVKYHRQREAERANEPLHS